MNKKLKGAFILLLSGLILMICQKTHATHIRAGEIIAQRVSTTSLTYRFSVIGYTDTGSSVIFGGGEIDFGDGTIVSIEEGADFFIREQVIDGTLEIAFNIFEIEHTFQAPGAYLVRYNEKNRNAGILNMSNSVDTPFYVETRILIDPFLGTNNTPVFLVPPVDEAAVGARFIHNAGAFDIDGDSLSYRITVPKQFKDREVDDYVDPNDPKFYGNNFSTGNENQNAPPTFEIDPITGDLVWDSPGTLGEYNVAFVVEEWRLILGQWFNLGYVTRDMQIIVEETDNERPQIDIPDEICVEAGTLISEQVIGFDPDGHDVKLEAFGGPFELLPDPATFAPGPVFSSTPHDGLFLWQTDCRHVRKRPYEVQFKVTDNPPLGPKLVDFKTLPITIFAPAPTGLNTTIQNGRSIELAWDDYNCGLADKMQIWRRVDSYAFTPDNCQLGIPENSGYELIATLDSIKYRDNQGNTLFRSSFLDDNAGDGLAPGANYCYRIVATFPEPAGGESVVSTEACAIILADAPVITNVDVIETSRTDGVIEVKWLEPFDIDQTQFPPPYTYEVFRSEGFEGNLNEVSLGKTTNTQLTDTGLNTLDLAYNYRIDLFVDTDTYVDSSSPASSVKLEIDPAFNSFNLRWEATVPWSNIIQDFPYHYIYRDHVDDDFPKQLFLIDSAEVTMDGLNYRDEGEFNMVALNQDTLYCYYVETKGSYGNPQIMEPLLNKSQLACQEPNDAEKPCTPLAFKINDGMDCEMLVRDRGCFANDFANLLSWELDLDTECDNDIAFFNIYYSQEEDGPFEIVGTRDISEGNEFSHENLDSFKGFYYLESVDRSDNPSTPTDTISFDNCPNFQLPNVFTPNGDNKNDLFSPLIDNFDGITIPDFDLSQCPRFVESVDFRVFDRNGGVIFNYQSGINQEGSLNSILINWDGKTNSGIELPSGVYFYTAEVTFDVLDPSKASQVINGWVQILK